jgi:hypothetical protein
VALAIGALPAAVRAEAGTRPSGWEVLAAGLAERLWPSAGATLASLAKLHKGDSVTITGTFVDPSDPRNQFLHQPSPEQMSIGFMPGIEFGILATNIRASAAVP